MSSGSTGIELSILADLVEAAAREYEGDSSSDYFVPTSRPNRAVLEAAIAYNNPNFEVDVIRCGSGARRASRGNAE